MYKALETTYTTAKYIYDIKESFDCKIFCNNCICEKAIIFLFVLAVYHFRLSEAFHARLALCTLRLKSAIIWYRAFSFCLKYLIIFSVRVILE